MAGAQFSQSSLLYTKSKNKAYLKSKGIFFTPKIQREALLSKVEHLLHGECQVLEPSAGSGEFIQDLLAYNNPDMFILAVELDRQLYERTLIDFKAAVTIHADFLDKDAGHNHLRYDLIIGNPPFFEIQKNNPYKDRYPDWFNGRTNIYTLFLLRSMELLKDGGTMAFIIPKSWMNGKYFEYLREKLHENGGITHLEDLSALGGFMKTSQATMAFIYTKGADDDKYYFRLPSPRSPSFYHPQKNRILTLGYNRPTLSSMGAVIETGPVVWNQVKDKLTNNLSDTSTPLIYSNNIATGTIEIPLEMKNGRKQYVLKEDVKTYTTPVLVLNRGFGARSTGGRYKLTYAICDLAEFTCENHTNTVSFPHLSRSDALSKLNIISKSLESNYTSEWCSLFLSTGQLSKTELAEYLPIFI
jgi:adenine-specific DNA-methyltransferase